MRLCLVIEPPELAALPWEMLYAAERHRFLAAWSRTPISRIPQLLEPVRSMAGPSVFRVLAVLPRSLGLDTDAEKRVLQRTETASQGRVAVDFLPGSATGRAIRQALRDREYHILHYAGHGSVRGAQARVYLDDESGSPVSIVASAFAQVFLDQPSVRMVMVNACEGAVAPAHRALAGIASQLAVQGVPAVVAMQSPVSNHEASRFAEELYGELTHRRRGGDVESALARARGALLQDRPDRPAFAYPVLFLRSPDGRLWHPHEEFCRVAGGSRFLVPFPRNPDFVGRRDELERLHRQLEREDSLVGVRPTGLVGLGGIGKTQLVVEYVYRYRGSYSGGIYWINAARPLLGELAELAHVLGLAGRDAAAEPAALAAWQALTSRADALVVFDNVSKPSDLARPIAAGMVPASLHCRVLFTTRQRTFPRGFRAFEIETLPEDAAMRLLLRSRSRILEHEHPDWGGARVICASLGYLPLALELAAAYLDAYPEVTLEGYLQRLRSEGRLATVDDNELEKEDLPTRHDAAVAATLQTQWSRIEDQNARFLFQAAGQFPEATMIPVARLSLMTSLDARPRPGRPSAIRRSLVKLTAMSLIEELKRDEVRLHPLVQEFAAGLASQDLRPRLISNLTRALTSIRTLNEQVAERGLLPVIEDARSGLRLGAGESQALCRELAMLERILDRESHNLAAWDAGARPALLSQQMFNRARELGFDGLARRSERRLHRLGAPYLKLLWKQGPGSSALIRTLIGHSKDVGEVELVAEDRLVISGSDDGTIKIWDFQSGQELRSIEAHKGAIHALCSIPGQRRVLSASKDSLLKVWDVETGQLVRQLKGHRDYVWSAAVLPDGLRAVSTSKDETLKLWNLETGQVLHDLVLDADLGQVSVDPDGKIVLGCGHRTPIVAWDVESWQQLEPPGCSARPSAFVIITPGGGGLLCDSPDHLLELRCLESDSLVWAVPRAGKGRVFGCSMTFDGRFAVLCLENRALEVVDLARGAVIRSLAGHEHWVRDVALSSDGRYAVSSSNDQTLKIWDLSVDACAEDSLEHHQAPIDDLTLLPGGDRFASACYDGKIKIWEVDGGRYCGTCEGHRRGVGSVVVAPGGRLISGSDDGDVRIWDVDSKKTERILRGHTNRVWAVALSGCGTEVVSASADRSLRVWNIDTGELVRTISIRDLDMDRCLVSSRDGRRVFAGGFSINAMDLERGEIDLSIARTCAGTYSAIELLGDGRRAVCAIDTQLQVWDLRTADLLRSWTAHRDFITALRVLDDERLVGSASYNRDLRIWDLDTGDELAAVATDGNVRCLTATEDGARILAGDVIGNVYCFELQP